MFAQARRSQHIATRCRARRPAGGRPCFKCQWRPASIFPVPTSLHCRRKPARTVEWYCRHHGPRDLPQRKGRLAVDRKFRLSLSAGKSGQQPPQYSIGKRIGCRYRRHLHARTLLDRTLATASRTEYSRIPPQWTSFGKRPFSGGKVHGSTIYEYHRRSVFQCEYATGFARRRTSPFLTVDCAQAAHGQHR